MSHGKSELDYLDVHQAHGGSRRWPFTKEQPKPTFCVVIFLHHQRHHVFLLLMSVVLHRVPTTESITMPMQTPCKTSFRDSQLPTGTVAAKTHLISRQTIEATHQRAPREWSDTARTFADSLYARLTPKSTTAAISTASLIASIANYPIG